MLWEILDSARSTWRLWDRRKKNHLSPCPVLIILSAWENSLPQKQQLDSCFIFIPYFLNQAYYTPSVIIQALQSLITAPRVIAPYMSLCVCEVQEQLLSPSGLWSAFHDYKNHLRWTICSQTAKPYHGSQFWRFQSISNLQAALAL